MKKINYWRATVATAGKGLLLLPAIFALLPAAMMGQASITATPPGTTVEASGLGGIKMIPTTSAPQARTPLIKAHPRSDGTSTLIWDAGKDHPAAEVWLNVNGHNKKLFATSSKGRRAIVVKPGESCLYILTESGQNLATVTVQAAQQGQ